MLSTVLQQLEPVSDMTNALIYGPLTGVAGNQLL